MLKVRLNLRKVAMIVACLTVTTVFASCDNSNPSDDGGGDNPAVTGDDNVSVKALVGTWYPDGRGSDYFWSFAANGRFAYYERKMTAYKPDPYTPATKYELYYQGKFRVNGSVIECYDILGDSFFDYGSVVKYFGDNNINVIAGKLLITSLKDSKKIDNFSMKFEFIDAMSMRIAINCKDISYDWDFDYLGDSHNVTIPTHKLPSLAWPKALLPAGTPEYSGGRIRSVEDTRANGDGELRINIDQTTGEAFKNYINSLLNAGWVNYWAHVSIEEIVSGSAMGCFKKGDLNLWLGKDKSYYYLRFW